MPTFSRRRFLAALQLEADQRGTARHLAGDDIRLRMVLAAGIDDPRDLRLLKDWIYEMAARQRVANDDFAVEWARCFG